MGNGRIIKFWMDTWLGESPLIEVARQLVDDEDQTKSASDYWSGEDWECSTLNDWLPSSHFEALKSISLLNCNSIKDKVIWGRTSNGKFSSKSAYQSQMFVDPLEDKGWKEIWSLKGPNRRNTIL